MYRSKVRLGNLEPTFRTPPTRGIEVGAKTRSERRRHRCVKSSTRHTNNAIDTGTVLYFAVSRSRMSCDRVQVHSVPCVLATAPPKMRRCSASQLNPDAVSKLKKLVAIKEAQLEALTSRIEVLQDEIHEMRAEKDYAGGTDLRLQESVAAIQRQLDAHHARELRLQADLEAAIHRGDRAESALEATECGFAEELAALRDLAMDREMASLPAALPAVVVDETNRRSELRSSVHAFETLCVEMRAIEASTPQPQQPHQISPTPPPSKLLGQSAEGSKPRRISLADATTPSSAGESGGGAACGGKSTVERASAEMLRSQNSELREQVDMLREANGVCHATGSHNTARISDRASF